MTRSTDPDGGSRELRSVRPLWGGRRARRAAAIALSCLAATVLTAGWSAERAPEPLLPLHRTLPAAPAAAAALAGVVVAPALTPVRLLPAVSAPTASSYVLGPATYDPCRAVHYVLSRAHLTPERAAAVIVAFRTLSAATGLVFVDDGLTDEGVSAHRAYGRRPGGNWTPVLVGWATAAEYPPLAGDVVGLGGSTQTGTAAWSAGRSRWTCPAPHRALCCCTSSGTSSASATSPTRTS